MTRRATEMGAWLDVIGVGEEGLTGLSSSAVETLEAAEVIIGGRRYHGIASEFSAETIYWPSPFSRMVETVNRYRGRKVALLVTGDPLWYSAGAIIARKLKRSEVRFHPQVSAFQLACARMGWSLADIETLTVHGRPIETVVPWFRPGTRMAVLTTDRTTPGQIAELLRDRGFGPSVLTVLAELGGRKESRVEGLAGVWAVERPDELIADFHTLCIACKADEGATVRSRNPGLPDSVFESDGNHTKSEVRALTLCALSPSRGELLWDVGTGCGTVAIEWARAARDAEAIGVDADPARLEFARRNAICLGAPRLRLVNGRAPDVLRDLPCPNAIFIGGGLSEHLAAVAIDRVAKFGRIVANAVTLESEELLAKLQAEHGGDLVRIAVSRAERLGNRRGWRPLMPVTQWKFVK